MKKVTRIICLALSLVLMVLLATGCGSSSSSYQLHNKDGSLNREYVNDMNEYFKEHPEKLP